MLRVLTAVCLFGLVTAAHLAWCRLSKKYGRLQVRSFLLSAAGGWAVYLIIIPFLSPEPGLDDFWHLPLDLSAFGLYLACIPVYMILYASAIIDSPTRTIIFQVKENGPLTYDDLRLQVSEQKFFTARLDKLVEHGYVEKSGGQYRLGRKALPSCAILKAYQKIIGRNIGG